MLAVVMNTLGRSSLKLFETVTGNDIGSWEGESVSSVSLAMDRLGGTGWLLFGMQDGRVQCVSI